MADTERQILYLERTLELFGQAPIESRFESEPITLEKDDLREVTVLVLKKMDEIRPTVHKEEKSLVVEAYRSVLFEVRDGQK